MKFCPECGTKLDETMRFCPECGHPVEISSQDPFFHIDPELLARRIKQHTAPSRTMVKESYTFTGNSMMTIDEVLSLLFPQLDILSRLSNAYPEEELYTDLHNDLSLVIHGFQQGNKQSLSGQDHQILNTLINFWDLIVEVLTQKDFIGYKNEITVYKKYISDLDYILTHGITTSQQVLPSSQRACHEDFDPSVAKEIESLINELHEMKPSFKREAYNPSIDYRQELYKLTGLERLKASIDDHILDIKVQLKRKELFPDLKINPSFNCIFKGKPGTGKTSVARLLSGILKQEGLISNGCYVEVDASSLVSGYIGFSAKITRLAALESFGGVLFIDEAYSLMNAQGSKANAGAEVIDTLTPLMENYRDKLTVILAGYDKEMDLFLQNANTGFPSRFKSVFQFDDYTDEELMSIFLKFAEAEHYALTPEAKKRVKTILWFIVSQKDKMKQFANARTARNLYEYIRVRCTRRIHKEGYADLCTIRLEDVNLERSEIDMIINK